MTRTLTAAEIRVLGCLVEKELATPEYYPMTINALVNACNQKSNRAPVVEFDETIVAEALESLRPLGLAIQSVEGGRAAKFCHNLYGKYRLDNAEMAVMAELLLRGPDPHYIDGIVQGGQGIVCLDSLSNRFINLGGCLECLSPLDHPMPDGINFLGDKTRHKEHGFLVARDGLCFFCFLFFALKKVFMGQDPLCLTNPFHNATGQDTLGIHVKELIF